jgi:hypothetical protein
LKLRRENPSLRDLPSWGSTPESLEGAPGEVVTYALIGRMEVLAMAVTGLCMDWKYLRKASSEPGGAGPGPMKGATVTPRKQYFDHGYMSSGSDKEFLLLVQVCLGSWQRRSVRSLQGLG